MTQARTPPHIFTLIALSGVSILTLNIFLPSLVNIAESFSSDYATVSLAVAGYLGMTAVLQIFIGPLSDVYGRRPVLLISLVIFLLASVGCLLAQNIWVFLAFRMLQGAVIAASTLPRVMVRDMLPPREAVSLLGYVAMAMAVAPMLGPALGGVLDAAFGWRSSFVVLSVAALILLVLSWWDLGETHQPRPGAFLDTLRDYPRLLGSLLFWGYASCMAFSIGAFFTFITGAPLVAQEAYGVGPGMLGVIVGSITGGFFVGSWVSGRFSGRFAVDATMLTGRIIGLSGLTLGLVLAWAGVDHPLAFFGCTIFVGVGNGISTPSSTVGVMSVSEDLAGTASGLAGALTVGVGAGLTWITGQVIAVNPTPITLLSLMFGATFVGLMSALMVIWSKRRGGTGQVST